MKRKRAARMFINPRHEAPRENCTGAVASLPCSHHTSVSTAARHSRRSARVTPRDLTGSSRSSPALGLPPNPPEQS